MKNLLCILISDTKENLLLKYPKHLYSKLGSKTKTVVGVVFKLNFFTESTKVGSKVKEIIQ